MLDMSRVDIDPYELFSSVSRVLSGPGLLLVSVGKSGKPNSITIGWRFVGEVWDMATFTAIVRTARYTHELIGQSMDFTVNVPKRGMDEALSICGTLSGRNVDKIGKARLTPSPARSTRSPIIRECVAHIECSVVCRLDMGDEGMTDVIRPFYGEANRHSFFIGEILHSYADADYASQLPSS